MKTIIKSLLILTVIITTSAFTNPIKKKIEIKEGSIEWTGEKLTGTHTGTIKLSEGYLELEDDKLVAGVFVADMTSLNCTDLEGESKGKLEGHLKSDDFFGVEAFPTATLVIKSATNKGNVYKVTGEMTIKGITKPITFDLTLGETLARASLLINRTEYGVRYGSGSFFDNLGDKTISDNFGLDVKLKF